MLEKKNCETAAECFELSTCCTALARAFLEWEESEPVKTAMRIFVREATAKYMGFDSYAEMRDEMRSG